MLHLYYTPGGSFLSPYKFMISINMPKSQGSRYPVLAATNGISPPLMYTCRVSSEKRLPNSFPLNSHSFTSQISHQHPYANSRVFSLGFSRNSVQVIITDVTVCTLLLMIIDTNEHTKLKFKSYLKRATG